ncbi:MAG: hypothetical protein M3P43_09115 [Actinomycetota bacterium]|nr:hypothetical protein [Actinomycetota bacterium]
MKTTYRDMGPRGPYAKTRKLIQRADEILQHYYRAGEGFALTLRQLFYKLVTENLIANKPEEYERLGQVMSDARYWGLIDWDMLIDRTRTMWDFPYRDDERDAIEVAAHGFMLDPWTDQKQRVEVWIEKDAAIGVIQSICRDLRVPYGSTRGYHSTSGVKQGASRIFKILTGGDQKLLALHLADHDPSGWDMTRDLQGRLREIVSADLGRQILATGGFEDRADALGEGGAWYEDNVEIRRLALNVDQVQGLDLLPQPLKTKNGMFSDTRAKRYVQETGRTEGWELDALEPVYLADLIREAVVSVRDEAAWDATLECEEVAEANLRLAALSWDAPSRIRAVEGSP